MIEHPEDLSSPQADSNHVIAERREKLKQLRTQGIAFPNDCQRTHLAGDLQQRYAAQTATDLEAAAVPITVAGRILLKRVMGKASFVTVQDMSGRIQLFLTRDLLGEALYDQFKKWDIGDIVWAHGMLFKTKTDELSVKVEQLRLITKSLRPLPEKFHGLADMEIKYRQRYVDLIVSPHTRDTFIKRSKIIAAIRDFMLGQQFLEVETPMLHSIPGGASAKPFHTFHNALDMPMFLRIAPELFLKRLVVGGFERVFEINRNFRNEGLSVRHNPEFTMMEFYAAYTDYQWLMDFTETCIRTVTEQVLGSTQVSYQGRTVDLGKPFERLTIVQAIQKHAPHYREAQLQDRQFLQQELTRITHAPTDRAGVGSLQLALFEAVAEPELWHPTYIIDYPTEVSPLARSSDTHPTITERFELFITGRELANGFSELNDPEDQAQRFHRQVAEKEAGDEEAMYFDADYIRALEYGMPPAAGCGIGVDRLVMLLTDSASIRDVILFPHLRPETDTR